MSNVKNFGGAKLLVRKCFKSQYRNTAWFAKVPKAPPDPIFGLLEAYKRDTSKQKVNLSVGAYRDDAGKPFVLQSVRKAELKIMCKDMDKEYAGMIGDQVFGRKAFDFAMGECNEFSESGRVVFCQSLSGSGAVCVVGGFLSKFFSKRVVYVCDPTWPNHHGILRYAGLCTKTYRYYNSKTLALDFECLKEDLHKIPSGSIVLFHASAHNPTGIDPTPQQWDEIVRICKEKQFYIVVDFAYQGFGSGDPEKDAYAVRQFAKAGMGMAICQSFAKNMGIYGERTGLASFICDSPDEAKRVESQVKLIARSIYSNPPINGARIALEILSDKELKKLWLSELKGMAERIKWTRKTLKEGLIKAGSKLNWDHLTNQIGMFSYTGIKAPAVEKLIKNYHIYMMKNGRISMPGLNSKNIGYVCESFHKATSDKK
ncbi:aspartate aminotransferase, mitochondrial-like [Diabrotica virgifera virgifera]|uniref:Aspartate aminotransferase, mitochondrial n=2 Tax=Diabrotica virgifera virgifera TaxID=50390 RepID=A0ABM5KBL7_DIAVI|nr:aspartate aminotransferase, mitochondrial-like [Diabrotica virgifera virgifera]